MAFHRQTPPPDAAYVEPTRCPFCRSVEIATISKVADVSSYWRCKQCGEVWNDSRAPRR